VSQQELIKQLISTIEKSIEGFNSKVPKHQQRIFDEVTLLLKDLEVKDGRIKQSVANLKLIGKIRAKLEAIVTGKEWTKDVKEYLKAFEQVATIQNKYFETVEKNFAPSDFVKEIRAQSMEATLRSLTENGINTAITDKVQDLLRQNIGAGAKYTDLMKGIRGVLTDTDKGSGALSRYTKQITTDAINQYSAQYTDAVTSDMGLDWFQYTGALVEDSRDLCKALVEKRYIHRSEIPNILRGKFREFQAIDGEINPKTKLPYGMIPETNAANFFVYRGGYQCQHLLVPADAAAVPKYLRDKF